MKKHNLVRTSVFAVMSLVLVALLSVSSPIPAGAQLITVDGSPGEWDSGWEIATDPTNDTCGDLDPDTPGSECPHDSPFCARTGYDLTGLSAHWNNNIWYFLVRVDGLAGDSDSAYGTCPSPLGYGTAGNDSGPLQGPLTDRPGIGTGEQYTLLLQVSDSIDLEAGLVSCSTAGSPGCALSGDVSGTGAFGTGVPNGAVEYSIPESDMYPNGTCRDRLSVVANLGSNRDLLGEDATQPNSILALQFSLDKSHLPATPSVGQNVTLYYDYTITGDSGVPATDVEITDILDTELTYQSCTAPSGGSCSYDSGEFSCVLPTSIAPGSGDATGQCSLVATVSAGTVQSTGYLNSNEGLCDSDPDGFTPTAVTLSSFTAEWDGNKVVAAWETALEINTVGFNVWRSTSADGGYVQVNSGLIPAESLGGVLGGSYSFTDAGVTPGTTYYYKLEELEVGGARNWYGPTSTGDSSPTAVTLSAAATALAWWPAAIGVVAVAGLATFVALRRRRQHQ